MPSAARWVRRPSRRRRGCSRRASSMASTTVRKRWLTPFNSRAAWTPPTPIALSPSTSTTGHSTTAKRAAPPSKRCSTAVTPRASSLILSARSSSNNFTADSIYSLRFRFASLGTAGNALRILRRTAREKEFGHGNLTEGHKVGENPKDGTDSGKPRKLSAHRRQCRGADAPPHDRPAGKKRENRGRRSRCGRPDDRARARRSARSRSQRRDGRSNPLVRSRVASRRQTRRRHDHRAAALLRHQHLLPPTRRSQRHPPNQAAGG